MLCLSLLLLLCVASASGIYTNTSSTTQPTPTPWIQGYLENELPRFAIYVPTELGPWDSVSIVSIGKTSNFEWVPGTAEVFAGPAAVKSGIEDLSTASATDVVVSTPFSSLSGATVLQFVSPEATNVYDRVFTATFAVVITASNSKRDEHVYYLTATVSLVHEETSSLPQLTTLVTTTCPGGKCSVEIVTESLSSYTTVIGNHSTVITEYNVIPGSSAAPLTTTTAPVAASTGYHLNSTRVANTSSTYVPPLTTQSTKISTLTKHTHATENTLSSSSSSSASVASSVITYQDAAGKNLATGLVAAVGMAMVWLV
ncbi:hypothetical protein KL933_001186 [Ogataea haglerorum]|uniref:Uncharacterized protein n=1 Tax=Ogataea haglerorum TaxID=1937702 RepID=A0AAN6D8W9_9ASCO|nr:uncharacterized protein KL911_001842 [Ogataea haglerorum]KAG7698240.1 hypothetical protein KL915_001957 [Ogataea haglerorum]KAG7721133.1 hypothetical protein KL913_000869 [Ogataea haglerorum]KAG7721887.1 hypothetical protein KL949_000865 [Ogataea haglerorum]KAG7730106.1 hypothetical protein KL933_001186 [Ogataea haglerorum]KAG7732467.1 hypothetical protein KL948_001897 [Ogataea haglerorum]